MVLRATADGRGLLYEGHRCSAGEYQWRWSIVGGLLDSWRVCRRVGLGRPTVAGGRGLVRLEVVGVSVDAELRSAMVDELRAAGLVTVAEVEAAMRAVPRHVFLPGVELVQAYGQQSVVTHRDADGVALSSASAPAAVAGMLEQLDVRPGHRVLEIGTGTGYNAALLARLVGPTGSVVSVEYLPDAAERARAALGRLAPGVRVVQGDGMLGFADAAPYDRIVVTAGAWDVAAAWWEQLAPDGVLVVPLRIRGLTQSVAFERHGDMLRSRSVEEIGFIPMKGMDAVAEQNIRVGDAADPDLVIRVDDGQSVDADGLAVAVRRPGPTVWTGVVWAMLENLPFWLASMPGFCRMLVSQEAVRAGRLVAPMYGWGSMGVHDGGTFGYLTLRPVADNPQVREIGACAYGPDAGEVAHRLAARVREWERDGGQQVAICVEAYRLPAADVSGALLVVDKKVSRIVVRACPQRPEPSSS